MTIPHNHSLRKTSVVYVFSKNPQMTLQEGQAETKRHGGVTRNHPESLACL